MKKGRALKLSKDSLPPEAEVAFWKKTETEINKINFSTKKSHLSISFLSS